MKKISILYLFFYENFCDLKKKKKKKTSGEVIIIENMTVRVGEILIHSQSVLLSKRAMCDSHFGCIKNVWLSWKMNFRGGGSKWAALYLDL